jgi:hypothetical protein
VNPDGLSGAALLSLLQGLRRERTRHPLTATVEHTGAEGEAQEYRLELWLDGHTARCTSLGDGFWVQYAPLTRTLRRGDARGLQEEQPDVDFPVNFTPLALGVPLSLPIWGDAPGTARPTGVVGQPGSLVRVDFASPEDGGEEIPAGHALIDTRLMCATELAWFGDHYRLRDPHRLTMPDWASLLD